MKGDPLGVPDRNTAGLGHDHVEGRASPGHEQGRDSIRSQGLHVAHLEPKPIVAAIDVLQADDE